jgi:hypothetical protein
MGGSTRVEANIRMQVWLETVPILLEKVKLEHVSIVTHSAGGIYTLNTLAEHSSVLDPKAPYVALLGTHDINVTRRRHKLTSSSTMGSSRILKRNPRDLSI